MDSTRGGMSTVGYSNGNDSTFIINGPAGGPAATNMAARLQIPAAELNHMFSPLALERMFQRAPSSNQGSSTNNTASIAGMLWSGGGGGAAVEEQGKTLQLLLLNGSNPGTGEQQMVTPVSPPNHIASPPSSIRGESAFSRAGSAEQFPAPLPPSTRRPMSMYDMQEGVAPQSAGVSLRHEAMMRASPHMTAALAGSSHVPGRASAAPELLVGRPRAYTYTNEAPMQPARAARPPGHHKALSQVAMGISRPSSVPSTAPGSARKGSDGSNVRLIRPDPRMPLPNRVGDMVLDRDAGWVNINEVPQAEIRRGDTIMPGSARSTVSKGTHVISAQPSPTNDPRPVHEMSERKQPERADSAYGTATLRDDGMGTVVSKLVPAPEGASATAVALSGVGIRTIKALPQLPTNIETMVLDNNKLQSLVGLPMGLVHLTVSANWLTFGSAEQSRFSFARELPHLEFLDASSNEIADIAVFSDLRHLRRLVVSRARISSMRGLVGCRRLEQLTLRDNAIAELDLDPAQTPRLASLDLSNNRLRVLPARISEFTFLRALNVDRNDLESIELCGAPSHVRELRLSENPRVLRPSAGIVDARAWQAKFPRLRTLYMDTCYAKQLVGALAGGPQTWPTLTNLSLRGYVTQPALAVDFACLRNMRNLYLPDTRLELPPTLPLLPHLRQLVISNADLQRLPANLGAALPALQHLDVGYNPMLLDLSPVVQLNGLEVLRAPGIGVRPIPQYNSDGLEEFPPLGDSLAEMQARGACALVGSLARLRRLR
ncbi:Leucine-rich repeat protein, partial [Linderina pennispora]